MTLPPPAFPEADGSPSALPQRCNTVIIGGGPAGMGVVLRAARQNKLEELLTAGVVLFGGHMYVAGGATDGHQQDQMSDGNSY